MSIENNNDIVTEQEVEIEFKRLLKVYANRMPADEVIKNMDSVKRQAREHAIGRKLLLKEANRLNMKISEDEITNEKNLIMQQLGGEEEFQAHIEEKGLTPGEMTDFIRDAILTEKLITQITADVPEASEEDAADFFKSLGKELPEGTSFDQIKKSLQASLTSASKNRKLLEYLESLKA